MTMTLPDRPTVAAPLAVTMTAQEYDAQPPDPRVELVDGVVQVMVPATRGHQKAVKALTVALEKVCPADLRIVWEQEVRLGDLLRRNPDVMAVAASSDDDAVYSFHPRDVLLAAEVVSPGTRTIDRLHKPAEYAAAGIAHYWRVEILPEIVLHTYRLNDEGRYADAAVFKAGDLVAAPGLPWAAIAVSDLAP